MEKGGAVFNRAARTASGIPECHRNACGINVNLFKAFQFSIKTYFNCDHFAYLGSEHEGYNMIFTLAE